MKITARHHITSIRYAITVTLADDEAPPAVGDTFNLADMDVVRVLALKDESRRLPGAGSSRARSMTVETLETIGRLPNIP